jgi:8-oxo-dGTP diphosphatase
MLELYKQQTKCLVALDSIIFGFDGDDLKLLLVKRGIEPDRDTWSLMGGWLRPNESLDEAANRILFELTNVDGVFLEQLSVFGDPSRDTVERTVAVAYYALVNVADYDKKISDKYNAHWFSTHELPELLFDHDSMIKAAIEKLRYKAAFHPIGFELMPDKFTIPQIQTLYEAIYDTKFDKRNFSRKILSTGLLVKLKEKQRGVSKKGAFLYKLDTAKYNSQFDSFHNFVPNPDGMV